MRRLSALWANAPGRGSFVPQRFQPRSRPSGSVVRVCDSGVMDETLTRAAAEIAGFASRPVYGLSDTQLCEARGRPASAGVRRPPRRSSARGREAHGRDLPRRQGAASTVAWLRDLLRITPAEARLLVTLGEVLDGRPTLADAVARGAVNPGQAVGDRPGPRRRARPANPAWSTRSRRSSSTTRPSSNRRSCADSANGCSPTSTPTWPTPGCATDSTAKNNTPSNAAASPSPPTGSAAPASAASSTPKAPPSSPPPSNH